MAWWQRRYGDYLALVFLLSMMTLVFTFELTITRPYLIENNYRFVWFHVLAAFFIMFNVCSYIYFVNKTETSTKGLVMPSALQPSMKEWRFCFACEANSPPRSFHCAICQRCILRRDHHCVFTSCCIGYKNYKYYMGLLFQISFACIYASFFHTPYIWNNMSGFNLFNLFAHCLPIPFFMFGFINPWTALCNMVSMLCIIGFFFAGGLFIYHFTLLVQNQTTYEKGNRIVKYRLKNWRLNLLETMGSMWPLTVFLTPFIDSKLPRDGIYFPTCDENKFSL